MTAWIPTAHTVHTVSHEMAYCTKYMYNLINTFKPNKLTKCFDLMQGACLAHTMYDLRLGHLQYDSKTCQQQNPAKSNSV